MNEANERFFVIFTDVDFSPSHAKPTHAVDILAFVEAQEIPSLYYETPYYLAPAPGDEKVYALLRETLRRTKKVGIAYVVIQARQHLAALIPEGQSLVLNTLRWEREPERIRSETLDDFGLDLEVEFEVEFDDQETGRHMHGGSGEILPCAEGYDTGRMSMMNPPTVEYMVMKKSGNPDAGEPDSWLDEDDYWQDQYLASVLGPRPHRTDAGKLRRARGLDRWNRRAAARARNRAY